MAFKTTKPEDRKKYLYKCAKCHEEYWVSPIPLVKPSMHLHKFYQRCYATQILIRTEPDI